VGGDYLTARPQIEISIKKTYFVDLASMVFRYIHFSQNQAMLIHWNFEKQVKKTEVSNVKRQDYIL